MNTDKQKINVRAAMVAISSNEPAEELIKELGRNLQKVKKDHSNISLRLYYDEGNENNLPREYIALYGDRFETDYEWHKRLEDTKRSFKRQIDEAERVKNNKTLSTAIEDIDAALKKSSLKCVDCGKPESSDRKSVV